MLKHVNVEELEARFIKLLSELLSLRARFYKEASASLNEDITKFESYRCEDGGLTEHACYILGIARGLEDTLHTRGIHEFMDAFEELDYDAWIQFGHTWWSLGLAFESVDEQIREVKKQLSIAKQNCQLKQAFKDAGF